MKKGQYIPLLVIYRKAIEPMERLPAWQQRLNPECAARWAAYSPQKSIAACYYSYRANNTRILGRESYSLYEPIIRFYKIFSIYPKVAGELA